MDREQRDALLLGDRNGTSGGTPALPEAFRAVLAHLYENGITSTRTLHQVICEQDVVAFKSKRILEVWETWETFGAAILGVLATGGYISGSLSDDGWEITPKAIPGAALTVLRINDKNGDRRIRVTFQSEKDRQARNDMQVVKNDIDSLLTRINRMKDTHPVYEKLAQYQLACSSLLRETLNEGSEETAPSPGEEALTSSRSPRRRKRPEMRRGGVVRDWVNSYMTGHPLQLMSIQDIAAAFDEYDAENIRSGRFGRVNTGTIVARLRDLNVAGPGRVEWAEPPEVRYVSVMYVPPEWKEE